MILSLGLCQAGQPPPTSRGPSIGPPADRLPSLSHPHPSTPSKNSGETLQRQGSMTPKLRNEVFVLFFKASDSWEAVLSLLGLFQSLSQCCTLFWETVFSAGRFVLSPLCCAVRK